MNTHTPGPWKLRHVQGNNFAVQRFEIRSEEHLSYPIFQKDCSAIDGGSVCCSPEDARLIAAAPDMHAILDELEDVFDKQTYDEKRREDFDAPDDREYSVTVTAKQLRAIGAALTKAGI